MPLPRRRVLASVAAVALAVPAYAAAAPPAAGPPAPGSPAYVQRDLANIADAFGRQTEAQLSVQYGYSLARNSNWLGQVQEQASRPTRPALGPGSYFPGWNEGNPYRAGWNGTRGISVPVSFTNRYGALLQGDVYAPLPGAHDPYTGAVLRPPFPGVVITTGSVQGSEQMYQWLAEDLAERGYLVLTYDVQGQGRSETFPHGGDGEAPGCWPLASPAPGETSGCPGVPSQQTANFVYGTVDATSFFVSTPAHPYRQPGAEQANRFDPLWRLWDRSPDPRSVTPGRHTRLAIVGHSLGATAVSYVQAVDPRVETVVALDKLTTSPGFTALGPMRTAVPALALQSEYGFEPQPYFLAGCSSFSPCPGSPAQAPDPAREEKTGFDGWVRHGVDTMLVVPRASTHLEYTDIPFALPASRHGQDIASYYVQAWLDKYLKHDPAADAALLSPTVRYLEPTPQDGRTPVVLPVASNLSFYFCSGYAFRLADGRRVATADLRGGLGCRLPG